MLVRQSRAFATQHLVATILALGALAGAVALLVFLIMVNDAPSVQVGNSAQIVQPAAVDQSNLEQAIIDRANRSFDRGIPSGSTNVPVSQETYGPSLRFDPDIVNRTLAHRSWGLNVGLDSGSASPAAISQPSNQQRYGNDTGLDAGSVSTRPVQHHVGHNVGPVE